MEENFQSADHFFSTKKLKNRYYFFPLTLVKTIPKVNLKRTTPDDGPGRTKNELRIMKLEKSWEKMILEITKILNDFWVVWKFFFNVLDRNINRNLIY